MDYFQELLNSYDKLKKRTFKLVFINEQEDPANLGISDDQAIAAIAQAISYAKGKEYPGVPLPPPLNSQYQVYGKTKSNPDADLAKMTRVGGGNVAGLGQTVDLKNLAPDQQAKVGRVIMGQPQQKGPELKSDTLSPEELASYEAATVPGISQNRYLEQLAQQNQLPQNLKMRLFKADLTLRKKCRVKNPPAWCSDLEISTATTGPVKQKEGSFAIGSSSKSFERKLSEASNYELGKDGKWKEVPLTLDELDSATDAWSDMTNFLTVAADPDSAETKKRCESITKRVGVSTGGEIVFKKGRNQLKGATVSTMGVLEQKALEEIKKQCPNNKIESGIKLSVSIGNKNAIKGTYFEYSTNISFAIRKMNELKLTCLENKDQKACKEYETVAKEITTDLLKWQARVQEASQGVSLSEKDMQGIEARAIKELITEHGSYTSEEVIALFAREAQYATNLIRRDFPNSTGALDSSLNPNTGDRADRKMIYTSLEAAQMDAANLGSQGIPLKPDAIEVKSVTEILSQHPVGSEKYEDTVEMLQLAGIDPIKNPNAPVVLFSVGLKRTTQRDPITLGTVNGEDRLSRISNGEELDRVSEGFVSWVDATQALSPSERRAALDYDKELMDSIKTNRDILNDNITQISTPDKESTDLNNPAALWGRLSKAVKGRISQEALSRSDAIRGVFFDCDGNPKDCTQKDWNDPRVLAQSTSRLGRLERAEAYRKDLADPKKKQACTDHLVRQLAICGGNKTDLVQSNVTDKGEITSFRHNAVIEEIAAAARPGAAQPLQIEVSPDGSVVKYKVAGKVLAQLDQSSDSKVDKTGKTVPHSVFAATITKEGQNKYKFQGTGQAATPKLEATELVKEFLQMQQRLLEMFNITNKSSII